MSDPSIDFDGEQFTTVIDGHTARIETRRDGDQLVLVHTIVPEELGGRGLGGQLVQGAVDHAAAAGLTIVAECTYAKAWLERHPDQAARVGAA